MKCSACHIDKTPEEFHKCASNKTGYQYQCISCKKEKRRYKNKGRQPKAPYVIRILRERASRKKWQDTHPEKVKALQERQRLKPDYNMKSAKRQAKYRREPPEKADEIRLRNRKWRESHKEHRSAYRKRYQLENADRLLEWQNRYWKSPQGRISSIRNNHRRRSRIKETECTLTLAQWEKILKLQDNRCVLCGKKFTKKNPATKDHIVPLSRGGGLTFENIQAAHKTCNYRKHAKVDKTNIVVWISRPELCGKGVVLL